MDKELCKRCTNKNTVLGWNVCCENDWKKNKLYCVLEKKWMSLRKDSKPPLCCPYILEQTVSE